MRTANVTPIMDVILVLLIIVTASRTTAPPLDLQLLARAEIDVYTAAYKAYAEFALVEFPRNDLGKELARSCAVGRCCCSPKGRAARGTW